MSSPREHNVTKQRIPILTLGIGLAIVLLSIAIYSPGLKGPFIFDDLPNIVYNNTLHIKQLSLSALNEAAHSLHSGPLGRPLAGVSFALNYYLADGVNNAFGFKVFNLMLHIINAGLAFWFVSLIISNTPNLDSFLYREANQKKSLTIFAGACSLIWLVHPIQVTSVLYVVQRMTSMAAMFILLSLIAYIYGRLALNKHQIKRTLIFFIASIIFAIAGVYSKETAFLLPLYASLIEFTLFYNQLPWSRWNQLARGRKMVVLSGLLLILFIVAVIGIEFSLPGYSNRDFTIYQRILTESRILFLYLGLIFIPRLSGFGLYHDDITISTSLLSPWTTLISIGLIIVLLYFAFRFRRKYPLLAFGVLWYFVSHTLESTIYPLELVHEHRNYLASLGPVIIIITTFFRLRRKLQSNTTLIFIPVLIIGLSLTTTVRTMQWDSLASLLESETCNHPESPRAWADLFSVQIKSGMTDKAISSIRKSINLRPNEPGYYLLLYLYTRSFDLKTAIYANKMLLKHIPDRPKSLIMTNTLQKITYCLADSCRDLQQDFSKWVRTALKYNHSPRYQYYLGTVLYLQDQYDESLKLLDASIANAKVPHVSPIIKRIQVLLTLNKIEDAKIAFTTLQKLNKNKLHVDSSQMQALQQAILDKQAIQK
jgi:tetratricopeptide (TPR) repeat protein